MPAPDVLYTVLVCVTTLQSRPIPTPPHIVKSTPLNLTYAAAVAGSSQSLRSAKSPTLRITDLGAVLIAAVVINKVSMSPCLGMVVELHQSLLSGGVRGQHHREGY